MIGVNFMQTKNSIDMIPAIISTIASLAMKSVAAKKAAVERRKLENLYADRERDLGSMFNQEYYQDFTDSPVAQSTISQLQSQMNKQAEQLDNNNAATGATAESNIATKGKLNEGYGEALNKLAGYGTNIQEQRRRDYDYRLASMLPGQAQIQANQVQDWGNFSSNLSNSLGTLLQAFATNVKKPEDEEV